MNKRIILSWLCLLPPLLLVLYIVLFQKIIGIDWIKNLVFTIIIILFLINIFYSLFVPFILCTPKSKLPKKIDSINFNGKIKVIEIRKGIFNVMLEHKKEFIIDMRGWIFKKTYVRDILLMYYHLNYYNMQKHKSFKCLSKKYFTGENKQLIFILKSGKDKYMWLIKDGKEKRSFLCDIKIFFTCTGALKLRNKYEPDEHIINTVPTMYI